MKIAVSAVALSLAVEAAAQTYTLSDCHLHGSVEYCYLPGGEETPWTTYSESATASTSVAASTTVADASPVTSTAEASATGEPVATGCHFHVETQFCMVGGAEFEVTNERDPETALEEYQQCHYHGSELHCTDDGDSVTLVSAEAAEGGHEGHDHEGESEETIPASEAEGVSCHSHSGVEHCVDAQGRTVETGCSAPNREYNVPLRIGLIFAILATSFIGVVLPAVTAKFTGLSMDHVVLLFFRQFGTGIILSTAFVHLFTHASLLFGSDCLTGVFYEATTAAILLAGLFIAFVAEYTVHRLVGGSGHAHHHGGEAAHAKGEEARSQSPSDEEAHVVKETPKELTSSVFVMEAGIIFHSILIGITLVVAADSYFITLFIVILFHQMFEGVALGSRIALLSGWWHKLLLQLGFAVTTPVGMAIGTGVLSTFNGNDPSTIIAIGTLDSFSAGVLLWVGLVEMLFHDWWLGPLAKAGFVKASISMLGLVIGLALMSLLGKWA